MKRFFSFMMVLVLVLSLGISVFADEDTGSITITNPTAGQEYRLYKIFNASYAEDEEGKVITGTDGKAIVSYTIDPDNQFFHVLFGDDGKSQNSFFDYTAETGVVTLKSEVIDTEVIAYLGSLVNHEDIKPDATEEAPDGGRSRRYGDL